jgi:hypothetical protein
MTSLTWALFNTAFALLAKRRVDNERLVWSRLGLIAHITEVREFPPSADLKIRVNLLSL